MLFRSFSSITPPGTGMGVSFKGIQNTASYTLDSNYINITDGQINEFTDIDRLIVSKSNELSTGNSISVQYTMTTSNTKISPTIDLLRNNITMTDNIICNANELSGYYLTITGNNVVLSSGTVVSQNTYGFTSTGIVHTTPDNFSANSTLVTLTNVNGTFLSNTNFSLANGYVGFAQTATSFTERSEEHTSELQSH